MHVTIPESEHLAIVLSDEDVQLLLGDDAIASWASDAAQRFRVSPPLAVRLLAGAIARIGPTGGGPWGPVVGAGS